MKKPLILLLSHLLVLAVGFAAGVYALPYRAVIVWCESFDQFITAAAYQTE